MVLYLYISGIIDLCQPTSPHADYPIDTKGYIIGMRHPHTAKPMDSIFCTSTPLLRDVHLCFQPVPPHRRAIL